MINKVKSINIHHWQLSRPPLSSLCFVNLDNTSCVFVIYESGTVSVCQEGSAQNRNITAESERAWVRGQMTSSPHLENIQKQKDTKQ